MQQEKREFSAARYNGFTQNANKDGELNIYNYRLLLFMRWGV